MLHRIKTQPAVEPVTLSEVRAFHGIAANDDNSRDAIITARIKAARQVAEELTNIKIITQTWTAYDSCFTSKMDLYANLQSVTSVKYYDPNGALQTLSPSVYYVDTVNHAVTLVSGQSWPEVSLNPNSVMIEYICGFGLANAVPETLKDAIKIIVSQWESYQSSIEGARVSTLPYAAVQLLDFYKDYRGYF
jgi:uncharacterized phiE125 gp8 family phage protein